MSEDWVKVVERRGQSVLISSYFYNGVRTKYFRKTLGVEHGIDHYLIVDFFNYYLESEVLRFQEAIKSEIESNDAKFISQALEQLTRKGEELTHLATTISRTKNLTAHPASLLQEFSELCLEFGPAMYFPILIEPIVEARALNIIQRRIPKETEKYFALLTASHQPTDGTKELVSFYRLAEMYHKNHRKITLPIKQAVDKHLRQFGWLAFTKFVGRPWTQRSIMARLEKIPNPGERLRELERQYKQEKIQVEKIFKEYQFTKAEREFLREVQHLAYFRTYRVDVYSKAGYLIKDLLRIISRRLDLTVAETVWLTYEEILSHLRRGKKFPRKIARKRQYGTWQLLFEKGKMTFQYEPPFLVKEQKLDINIVKGTPACSGKAEGPVAIIRGVKEFDKMTDKAILVTSMTTPDFVPLMQQAAAIITDEGGITCHAAIVSRELGVPCVIGTKIATKALKDGDVVEVDADKGLVRKLA